MWRRLLNLLTVLSLVLCVAWCALWVDGLVAGPRRFIRGSIAGGWGVGYDGAQAVIFAGDLTGVRNETHLREWRGPGTVYRRVTGPQPSTTLFLMHWLPVLISGSLPAAVLAARLLTHRRRRREANLCPACGYDLRATPDRCPECGTAKT